jgi:hypothetical protein
MSIYLRDIIEGTLITGPQGPQGATGPTGPQGDIGPQGPTGPQGSLNDLNDVTITTPSSGQVLKYDGSAWINDTDATGAGGGSGDSISSSNTALTATANSIVQTSNASVVGSVYTYILTGTTTNNTPTELFLSNGSKIPIVVNTTIAYTSDFVGRITSSTAESCFISLKGLADNYGVGTSADVGDLYEIVVAKDDTSVFVDMLANNTTDTLNCFVTGPNSKTYNWVVKVEIIEV